MGLRNELRAFITAISSTPTESKKNKQALERIFNKHLQKSGQCMFCGQEYDSEIKALLFARQKIVEPYDVPPDFKVDTRLKEIGWDVELKGDKYNE